MSNLVKSNSVYREDKKRVIDSNQLITDKLSRIKDELEHTKISNDGFSLGLNAEHVEVLLSEEEEPLVSYSEEKVEEIYENANLEAENIIKRAREEAEKILDVAREEAENIFSNSKEEGFKEGFLNGQNDAAHELNHLKEQLLEEKEYLQLEYEKKVKKIEPELVEVILKVFEKVTKIISMDKKDMILNLVDSVLNNSEFSKNYIIRVSKEDAPFLRDNREKLTKNLNRDVNIEIIEDPTMLRNQCLIDTDLGIYDCSLDIQLENLIRDIKILSSIKE